MAIPSKAGKTLVQYDVKNAVYVDVSAATPTIAPFNFMTAFSKERVVSTTPFYGDGEIQTVLVSDQGYTATISTTAKDDEFETMLGLKIAAVEGGILDRKQLALKEVAFGFECYAIVDGVTLTKKVWVFGCLVTGTGDSLAQNTESPNPATVDYNLTVLGIDVVSTSANTAAIVKCTTWSKVPTDASYATFLDTYPTPTIA